MTKADTRDEWCWALTPDGRWHLAANKEVAIAEGRAKAVDSGSKVFLVGNAAWCTHQEMVRNAGFHMRYLLEENAHEAGEDFGDGYPVVDEDKFDKALESWLLQYLNEHAEAPAFFSVINEDEYPAEEEA